MARTTVAQLETLIATQQEQLDKLTAAIMTMAAQQQQPKQQPKQKQQKPWLSECPDYATAAQRVEFEKLAKRAKQQREAIVRELGTESVSCFIPVAKQQDRMPHSIRWTATYSK